MHHILDTSDCDEIIANNNAPVTAIDNNIALVHFGRELHQLSVQIFPKFQSSLCQVNPTSVIETEDSVQTTESGSKKHNQTPPLPKNGSSSCAKSSNNNEHISNGLCTVKHETLPENENGDYATVINNGHNANVKELKMMQEAFSLMAYIDPWKSPVSRQLDAEQREPIAAAVNSLIMEKSGREAWCFISGKQIFKAMNV
uniref:CTLH/CRA C-terminal to LisH motif domain-containing protein n=1 Tax=Romanomermis culicivorax TaxID=13658 RepID=A0A915KQV7_ROMCU